MKDYRELFKKNEEECRSLQNKAVKFKQRYLDATAQFLKEWSEILAKSTAMEQPAATTFPTLVAA